MFLITVVLASMYTTAFSGSAPHANETFAHEDPVTGKVLICDYCPPGHFVMAHCTAGMPTLCKPCPPNYFTEFWNYLPKCLFCSTFCDQNQVVKKECTAVNNRVCECKGGYFLDMDFCIRHKKCAPGQGIKRRGTPYADTECEGCPDGTFSSESYQTDACAKHTDCKSQGLRLALNGTSWHDNLCTSCEENGSKGGLDLLREIVPAFFAHENIQKSKIRKLVRIYLSEVEDLAGRRCAPLTCVDQWAKLVPEDRLKQLPDLMLRASIFTPALKLEKMIADVEGLSVCELMHNRNHTRK
ncbi:tumor necrosis factor receptor superfamily member 11B-like isoform X2 [Denticeps clupeoides]|uniref:tumor necrosis factor receptor superfamily member 11B-like isoform X2 n=1 Tax=Denticeps clupeoides TaxID=299321 RepID=UPI0010A31409|nr:tumor necrosis factor receptor superfamily member 11B-like isoform X2 [Denticeps clupeoides]